jgi:ATP-dependent RNA helicase SUPV3L1/SUV3
VQADGKVVVEGHPIGRLDGFSFVPEAMVLDVDAKPVLTAARRALRSEIARRIGQLAEAADADFTLSDLGEIEWRGAPVARFAPGGARLKPRIRPLPSDLLVDGEADKIRDAVTAWLERTIAKAMPMLDAIESAPLEGAARGLAFHLTEALAPIDRAGVEPLIAALKGPERKQLARLGIRIGPTRIFLAGLLKPAAIRLRAALWRAEADHWGVLPLPPPGRVSVPAVADIGPGFYEAIGYPVVGGRAIRVDILDRLIDRLRRATVKGAMPADEAVAPMLGCGKAEADQVLAALGWGRHEIEGVTVYRRQRPHRSVRQRPDPARLRTLHEAERSPFAVLKQLVPAK